MKLLLTIILASVCLNIKAQIKDTIGLNLPIKEGRIVYQGVVDVPNKTKNDIYNSMQQWFIDYFNSGKDVLQGQDKDLGIMSGKGLLTFQSGIGLGMTMDWGDFVTIKIECKDNKYRYTFYDNIIRYNYTSTEYTMENILDKVCGNGSHRFGWTKKAAKNVLIHCDEKVRKAISSLKDAVNKTTAEF